MKHRAGTVLTRLLALAVVVLAVAAIGWSRPQLARNAWKVKAQSDVYALPPPAALRALSLGYRSALADYLWAHVLVTQGLRASERRPFEYIEQYLDAINDLDPKFREPYRLADSIFFMQMNDPDRAASARKARRILERGLRELPYDAELWLNYGQFLAYLASGTLQDPEERKAWREEGARALARVADLAGADDNLLARSMSAATLLSRQGEQDAAIRFLERAYAMTENEETREDIHRRLTALLRGREASRKVAFAKAFDDHWRETLPFGSRAMLSVLGPNVATWRCAGPVPLPDRHACQRDWTAWSSNLATISEQR